MGFTKLMTWSLNLLNFGWSNDSLQLSPQQVVRQTHLHRCPLPVADNTIWVADYRSLFYPSRVDIGWRQTRFWCSVCWQTHTVRSLKPWFTPNPVGVSRHWPIPFFWISLDVHPSKYTGAGTKSRERRKKFFGFPLLSHPTSGKIWENDTRQLPLPPQVHR